MELLAPYRTRKLGNHAMSAGRECLFNVSGATLQTWRSSPSSATRGRAMP